MQYSKLFPNDYPLLLKQLVKQPPYLYHAGAPIPSDNNKSLCVVGSRKYSDYGKQACSELIAGLKNYPIVIVSGLALGIDSLAHVAALENGLRTIAIPGSGLDDNVIYPRSHYLLAKHIIESGNTLLSPFEPYMESTNWSFPVRNQLMAGISHAVLVIEGRKKSGTLLTARYALDIDRDVMIVPGSIFSELSYGPHILIRDGAIPVTRSEDILRALLLDVDNTIDFTTIRKLELSQDEEKIVSILRISPRTSSELLDNTLMNISIFNIVASRLELKGIIYEKNGMYRLKN